jgi:hypothetical protein
MAWIEGNDTLSGTCGVGLFYGFRENNWYNRRHNSKTTRGYGGCGWQIAGFINDSVRKEVYEDLKERFKIVMQSPVRHNNNSRNMFFFVVYDTKKPRKSKNNPNPVWDLSGNTKCKWPWENA